MLGMTKIWHRILHLFGRHRDYVIRELTPYSRKVGCRICDQKFYIHDIHQTVLPWDSDFQVLEKSIDAFEKQIKEMNK